MPYELSFGGVQVHPQWVLSDRAGLGLEDHQEPGSRVMETSLIIKHPEYDKPAMANDLMFIELKEPVLQPDPIQHLRIAFQCVIPGNSCVVSGRGSAGGQPAQNAPMRGYLGGVCNTTSAPDYHPSMFCAGGQDGKDSVTLGAPLSATSFCRASCLLEKTPCGQWNVPGIYTNLFKFTDWIQKTSQD
uniref:Peptidase S1 domain-containing protein n=1 Tax=Rhinolophus ferrumequinum TaxID=59479 RepID=A0A671EBU8_RHIFE